MKIWSLFATKTFFKALSIQDNVSGVSLMINLNENDFVKHNKTAIALGVFDGVHKGHQAVIGCAVSYKDKGLSPAVFTFKSKTVTSKFKGQLEVLISDELKTEKLENLGVEYIYSPDFDTLKELSADEFVSKILIEKLNAQVVVCGENFHFGKGGKSGSNELSQMCRSHGILAIVVPFTCFHSKPVSSTLIRESLKAGDIETANEMLGYDYHFRHEVIRGNQIGKTIDFPTINQKLDVGQVVPKYGVYVSVTTIDDAEYLSITNIGIKPTIGGETSPLAETFIINYSGDLYGQLVTVYLKHFIRPEKKFSGLEELKNQLALDLKKAEEYYSSTERRFINE